MTRFLLTLIGLLTMDLLFGQKDINNVRTEQHRQIKGTKFFLVPPAGFTDAAGFQGFQQQNTGSSILVMEVPGPFAETTGGFNEQGLKAQGVILKKKEEVKINGHQGLFLRTEQSAYGNTYIKYILVFGNSKATYMVNGVYPEDVPELDKDIVASMFSTVYEEDLAVDPLGSVSFAVDTEGTKLKFGKNMTGMLLYTADGKVPTESPDKTSFIVGLSLADVEAIDKKQTSVNRLKQMPYTDLKIREDKINTIEIDGISGYEIVAEGTGKTRRTKKELIYQVMLFTDSGYYIMVGTAKDSFENNLELFRKIAKTFRRK